jgi:hypothetical protein
LGLLGTPITRSQVRRRDHPRRAVRRQVSSLSGRA